MYKVKTNLSSQDPGGKHQHPIAGPFVERVWQIGESVFRDRNLFNLQKIFLHQCGIRMVVGRCFEGITNLVEVA